MPGYFMTKAANCKNCHKCIRHCPVKAIGFAQNQAHILEEECILCGKCRANCPQNLKSIRDDLPDAQRILQEEAEVYASVAPSFAAAFPDSSFSALKDALLALGFTDAKETAVGATVVKRRYEEMLCEGTQSIILSSCCSSVNTLVRKYYPEAVPHLAKVVSPMLAHGMMLKKAHPNCKVIFIGPCVSKKAEAEEYPGAVDCVLTFEDLSLWLEQECIVPERSSYPDEMAGRARLFPTAGGIIDCMEIPPDCEYSFMAVDGIENCIAALEDIKAGNLPRCFIEMSACTGSCIGGPAIGKTRSSPVRNRLAVRKRAGKEDFPVESFTAEDLERKLPVSLVARVKPGSSAIREVLNKMGKTLPEHELNCGSCGYETCRDKVAAVLAGKAEINMCLPYLMRRAKSFSDNIISNTPNGIIVLNRAMEIQQINAAACRILNVREEADVLGRNVACILNPEPFVQVIMQAANLVDAHMFLAEYARHIRISIMLEQNYDIILAFMRDVTEKYTERADREEFGRKAVEITDQVIEKQMRTVQEIAALLGETAAESKVALERLKAALMK